jgi:hypothetical protein
MGEKDILFTQLKLTFSLQELSIEIMETQTEKMDRAGDQSSVNILRQMWPE